MATETRLRTQSSQGRSVSLELHFILSFNFNCLSNNMSRTFEELAIDSPLTSYYQKSSKVPTSGVFEKIFISIYCFASTTILIKVTPIPRSSIIRLMRAGVPGENSRFSVGIEKRYQALFSVVFSSVVISGSTHGVGAQGPGIWRLGQCKRGSCQSLAKRAE